MRCDATVVATEQRLWGSTILGVLVSIIPFRVKHHCYRRFPVRDPLMTRAWSCGEQCLSLALACMMISCSYSVTDPEAMTLQWTSGSNGPESLM